MTIAYYITAHGFGHFVRSAAVIKELPAEVPLAVRTDIADWFLRQELAGRHYHHYPAGFDCGTLGKDSTSVDTEMTFAAAADVMKKNATRLKSEIHFLKSHQVRVVVTDMPSFPLVAAKRAGIPSICITNFTWVEIYAALAERARLAGEAALAASGDEIIRELRGQYAHGDLLMIPGMALEMGACARRLEIPVIARTGRARRALLCERLGLDPALPIYLLYLGREGYAGMEWERIKRIPRAQFFSFTPPDPAAEGIVHVLPKGLMDHSDATATADAVVGKLGYSLCAECAATRRPLVFPPRPDFIEAEALGGAMMSFGLGVPLESEAFRRMEWGEALERALDLGAHAAQPDCSGAQVCAEIIKLAWHDGSLANLPSEIR